jgi:hypothetical protein
MDVTLNGKPVHGLAAVFLLIGVVVAFLAILLAVPALSAGTVLLFVRGMGRARTRQLQIKQFADAAGWSFIARDDRQAPPKGRPPFDRPCPRAQNVLSRTLDNRQIVVFQYAGQNEAPSAGLAVCAVTLPALLPYLEVGPRTATVLAEMPIGTHDIEIESEDFNRRFTVWADDPKYASDVVSPQLAAKLLESGPYRWRLEGDRLMSWAAGPIDTNTLRPWVATLLDVVDSIPDFVWHEHGPTLPPAAVA